MINFFNDTTSDFDYLGYYPYIESFNYILTQNNKLITPPLVFGIHGKWGEGKTTFMNLIKKRVEKSFYTIEINPWEYGDTQNFITIFLSKLYQQVRKDIILRGKNSVGDFLKAIFKPLKLSLDISPIKAEYDFNKFSFDEQNKVLERFVLENFALKESISYILDHNFFEKKKIIVFIDDLDRCSVEKVMEVIESIKLLFNSKNCIFFLGCDINYIQSALANKYKKVINPSEDNASFSREYLEKIIQIPFYIPKINEDAIKNYVNMIIGCSEKENKKIIIKEDLLISFQKDIQNEFISNLIIFTKVNPRRIKRIINLTFLNYVFLKFKNSRSKINIDTNLLALLCVVREVYPEYYKEKISYEQSCLKIFNKFFNRYLLDKGNNMDEDIEDSELSKTMDSEIDDKYEESVYNLFELYFDCQAISEVENLNSRIKNISMYISVSNLSSSEDYSELEWGKIADIKSTITGKKLKIFLMTLTNNSPAKNFIYWFFNDIYNVDPDKYILGIVRNVQVYRSLNGKRIWLFRFDFDRNRDLLYINFEWRNKFKTFFRDIDGRIKSSRYIKKQKRIYISQSTTQEELVEIKDDILSLVSSLKEIDGIEEIAATNNW